jgi:hypothetical protein
MANSTKATPSARALGRAVKYGQNACQFRMRCVLGNMRTMPFGVMIKCSVWISANQISPSYREVDMRSSKNW